MIPKFFMIFMTMIEILLILITSLWKIEMMPTKSYLIKIKTFVFTLLIKFKIVNSNMLKTINFMKITTSQWMLIISLFYFLTIKADAVFTEPLSYYDY